MSINKKIALLLLTASAPVRAEITATRARYVMGTVCEITATGPQAPEAVTEAFEEIERWDRILSSYKEESEASRMNRQAGSAPFPCSESLWEAVTLSLEMARRSAGAFDPTLTRDGFSRVRLDPVKRSVTFEQEGLKLDFGGIGKGLALDHAARRLRRRGVAAALLNFGGQIYALGAPAGKAAWTVESAAGPIPIKDASLSTSGDSERPGHIVSPFTGRPVRGPDATVLAPSAAEADAWSTALYVTKGRLPSTFAACTLCRYIQRRSP
jgi:thiamine biosynthesis lipoprotein